MIIKVMKILIIKASPRLNMILIGMILKDFNYHP